MQLRAMTPDTPHTTCDCPVYIGYMQLRAMTPYTPHTHTNILSVSLMTVAGVFAAECDSGDRLLALCRVQTALWQSPCRAAGSNGTRWRAACSGLFALRFLLQPAAAFCRPCLSLSQSRHCTAYVGTRSFSVVFTVAHKWAF